MLSCSVFRVMLLGLVYRFWRGMYNRFENGIHPREPVGDLLAATTEHTQALTDQAEFLTKVGFCCTSLLLTACHKLLHALYKDS